MKRLILGVLLVVIATGCVVKHDRADLARCKPVDDALVAKLQKSVTKDDEHLRRLHQVESEAKGYKFFVSAEVVNDRDGEKDDGDIATWTMDDRNGTNLRAAEEHSQERTTIEHRPGDPHDLIDVDGYVVSRGCIDWDRPPAPLEQK